MNKVDKNYLSESSANDEYYIIEKNTNCIIFLGKLLKYKENTKLESCCWHDGPKYEYTYNIIFDNIKDKKLEKELDCLTDLYNFSKKYDFFYKIKK